MQWGDKVDMLHKMQEQGQTPQALLDRPSLMDRLSWFYNCFCELSSDRGYIENTPLRLTTGQIHIYWSAYKLYDFEGFAQKMRLIDHIWHTKVLEKQAAKASAAKRPNGSPPPRLNNG